LHAAYAAGEGAADLAGIRIPRGQRLSGWVAANKQTILNSDPVLDLGDVARAMRPRLHSCLSTPLITDGDLLGVLTLYTGQREAFSEDHRRVVEAVATQVGHSLKQALGSRSDPQDTNPLPTIAQLEKALATELSADATSIPASLIFIRCECPRAVKAHDAERTIAILLESITAARGTGHALFQYRNNEFVLLLRNTDAESAASVARRIANSLSDRKPSSGSRLLHSQISIKIATAPNDGVTLSDLASASSARNTVAPLLIDLGSPSVH
jgi:GAF domain-containing protein